MPTPPWVPLLAVTVLTVGVNLSAALLYADRAAVTRPDDADQREPSGGPLVARLVVFFDAEDEPPPTSATTPATTPTPTRTPPTASGTAVARIDPPPQPPPTRVPPGSGRLGNLILLVVATEGYDPAATGRELDELPRVFKQMKVPAQLVSGTAFRAGPDGLRPWADGDDGKRYPSQAVTELFRRVTDDAAVLAGQTAEPDKAVVVLLCDRGVSPVDNEPEGALKLTPRVIWLTPQTEGDVHPTLVQLTRDRKLTQAGPAVERPRAREGWPRILADDILYAGWGQPSPRPGRGD